MRKFLSALKQTAGFTMIELLIVISILGILAVAVLAAINPIEQINRGRDTGSRSDIEQLISAMDRYYAFNGYHSWQTGATDSDDAGITWVAFEDTSLVDDDACPVAEKLGTAVTVGCNGADELKSSFLERVSDTSYNTIFIFNDGSQGGSTYACFAPRSKAFVTEVNDRIDPDGDGTPTVPTADYPSSAIGNATDCGDDTNCLCLP